MQKKLIYLFHSLYWISFISIVLIILIASGIGEKPMSPFNRIQFITIAIIIVPSIISFYSSYHFIFPKYIKTRSIPVVITYASIIAASSSMLSLIITSLIIGNQFPPQNSTEVFSGKLLLTFNISILSLGTGFILKGFISWYSELRKKEELQQKAQLMELSLIESKLAPHFLFNTINNINVLVLRDAQKASDYLNKLSSILRFTLYESKGERIKLSKELDYIVKYIELQKIRTFNQKYIDLKISGDCNDLLIYPMTFIPFIENAFKHSTNKKIENAISIDIIISNTQIHFTCINKLNPKSKKSKEGIGNKLIERRLQLLYPEFHRLEVYRDDYCYKVKLKIEL